MTRNVPPATTPAFIRETILFAFTRSAGLVEFELSDETAFMIMSMLDDLWLWFDTLYGDQARRYRPPDVPALDEDPLDDPF